MEEAQKVNQFLRYWNTLRRYKWVIIFPTVTSFLIYQDYTRTQRYKAEKTKLTF